MILRFLENLLEMQVDINHSVEAFYQMFGEMFAGDCEIDMFIRELNHLGIRTFRRTDTQEIVYKMKADVLEKHLCRFNDYESRQRRNAKITLKRLLEKGIDIEISRKCCSCTECDLYEIPGITPGLSDIILSLDKMSLDKNSPDVSYVEEDQMICLFEFRDSCLNPEPWFELDAKIVMETNDCNILKLNCSRYHKCSKCLSRENMYE